MTTLKARRIDPHPEVRVQAARADRKGGAACQRCGHAWLPRISTPPVRCPRCSSVAWDKPRKGESQ